MSEFNNYEQEREEVLRSMDRDRILSWMRYYRVDWMPYSGPEFWISVHKERLRLLQLSPKEINYELHEIESWINIKKAFRSYNKEDRISKL